MGLVFGQAQGAWSSPLLWSGWLSSSSTETLHKYIQICASNNLLKATKERKKEIKPKLFRLNGLPIIKKNFEKLIKRTK